VLPPLMPLRMLPVSAPVRQGFEEASRGSLWRLVQRRCRKQPPSREHRDPVLVVVVAAMAAMRVLLAVLTVMQRQDPQQSH
jgi:hypothetical protein